MTSVLDRRRLPLEEMAQRRSNLHTSPRTKRVHMAHDGLSFGPIARISGQRFRLRSGQFGSVQTVCHQESIPDDLVGAATVGGKLRESCLGTAVCVEGDHADISAHVGSSRRNGVEGGDTLIVSRNGVPVAELRPIPRRALVATAELKQAWADGSQLSYAAMRAEMDELFGEDRIDGGTP